MTDAPKSREDLYAEAHEWRILLDSSKATAADKERFEAWISEAPQHAEYYDKAVTMWAALGHVSRDDIDADLLKAPMRKNSIAEGSPGSDKRKWRLRKPVLKWSGFSQALTGASVAAIACLVAVIIMLGGQNTPSTGGVSTAVFESSIGEFKTINLEDGSTVTLGAASMAEAVFSADERRVTLIKGVALFDVAHDPERPFSVETEKLTVTALGTSFEVRNVGGVFRVAVSEGNVAVSYPVVIGGRPSSLLMRRELSVGETISSQRTVGLAQTRKINPEAVGAWRKDRLIYYGAALSELVADANRYSEIPVLIDENAVDVAELPVRGAFNARDIDAMLSSLEAVHPVTVDRSVPDKVVIRARVK
ncbi:MAG: FecR domain-containing protein [Pseudomonadota bacterium]